MKRFIITSACTLVLSLIGAFGSNQNLLNFNEASQSNPNTTQVVKDVTDIDNNQSLPSDSQITAAVNAATDTDTNIKEETPDKNEDAKDIYLEENLNNEVQNVTNNDSSSSNAEVKDATAVKSATYTKPAAKKMVYKNVDLSNCKSVKQVVIKLQKNGCKNITMKNVSKISGLKDVLAQIQANKTVSNSKPANTPAPTTVPTKKPTSTATPTPTTKPSTSTNTSGISSYASEVLRLVNIERSKAGLSALTTNQTISSAANKRAQEIVSSFSHTRPNGSKFYTALQEFGVSYQTAGENIAYGQKSPQEVVTGWMNSPGHRANILNGNFNKLGIGVYQKNGVIYWTQLFTN